MVTFSLVSHVMPRERSMRHALTLGSKMYIPKNVQGILCTSWREGRRFLMGRSCAGVLGGVSPTEHTPSGPLES